MRKALRKNWAPKVVALVLATAIWMLIRAHLESKGLWVEQNPPRADKPTQEVLEEDLRKLRQKTVELETVLSELEKETEEEK